MQKPQCFSVYFLKNLSWFDLLGIGALSAIYSDFHDEWSKFCRRMVFCFQNCSDLLNEKKCSSDREKLLKFEAKGREFSKILRSLEQFIQTMDYGHPMKA